MDLEVMANGDLLYVDQATDAIHTHQVRRQPGQPGSDGGRRGRQGPPAARR